jgi:S1-C subfamily serine protease
LLAAALCAPGACTTVVPLAPVPEPLPEALSWREVASTGAFLGLNTEENSTGSLDGLLFKPGVRVVRVVENSPAEAAGMSPGDVVLALDGETLNDPGTLEALVQRHAAGASIELTVQRGDTAFGVPITLAAVSAAAGQPARTLYRLDPARSRAGWSTGQGGVVLVAAADDSPVRRAGMAVGDVVLALDGEPMRSARELIRALTAREPGERVSLTLAGEDGRRRELDLKLLEPERRLTEFKIPFLFRYERSPDGSTTSVDVLDLWFFELIAYARDDGETRWTILEIFGFDVFSFATGVGELAE